MPDKRSPGRGRRATPPPRDILAGRVRAEELPDVARPDAPPLAEQHTSPDAAPIASSQPPPVNALARSVLELGRIPLAVTEATLDGQARTIDDWLARGAVPTVLVPGAVVLTAEIRLLTRMLRAVSGPKPTDP
jgi:hypothetical protein